MITPIALFILFATTFGAFVGLRDDARDKIWAYVALRALLLAVSYGAAIAVFWFTPSAWPPVFRILVMLLTFYVLAKITYHFVCESKLNRKRYSESK